MKTKQFFLPMLVGILAACNSPEEMTVSETTSNNNLRSYSIEEVLARAENYYNMLPDQNGVKTRASHPVVKNIYSLSRGTRSEEEDAPVYYLINYEDEEGFAIVGGNSNSRPLLAISDESNLTSTDLQEIPGVNEFVTYSITLPTQPIDTLTPRPTEPLNISISPKIHYKVRQWGQTFPFNSFTPVINGQHTPAGCVPIATAILMSYYETPTTCKDINLDWKAIKQACYTDELGELIAELGEKENLAVEYTLAGSGSNLVYVPRTMQNHGYTKNHHQFLLQDLEIYPTEEGKNNFNKQLPLIIRGGRLDSTTGKEIGHAWIIDGLFHIPTDPDNLLAPNPDPDAYFLHCVWGWSGQANGYFLFDGLGRIGGERYSKDSKDYTYPGINDTNTSRIYDIAVWGYYGFMPAPIDTEIVGPFKP